MDPSRIPTLVAADPGLALAVFVRMAAAVAAGCLPLVTLVDLRVRAAAALALTAASLPAAAAAAAPAGGPLGPLDLLAEGLVGLGLGLGAATAFAAADWAGRLLGSVAGTSWAEDFTPAAAGEGGAARLATWLALGGFLAAGGHLVVVGGLVDGLQRLPVGGVATAELPRIGEALAAVASAALALALGLAAPALAAVTSFHVAVALCLRCVRFTPGPGLVQAGGSFVLLAAVVLGAAGWTGGFATAVLPLVEGCLAP